MVALDYANIASPLLDDRWTCLMGTTHFLFDLLNPKENDVVYVPSSDTGIPLLLFGSTSYLMQTRNRWAHELKPGKMILKETNKGFTIATNATSQYNRVISIFSLLIGGRNITINLDAFTIQPNTKELGEKFFAEVGVGGHEDYFRENIQDALVFDPFNFFLNAIRNLPDIENVLSNLLSVGHKIAIPMPDTILRSQSEQAKDFRARLMKKWKMRAREN